MTTSAPSGQTSLFDRISSAADSRVRTCPAQESARVLLAAAQVSGVSLLVSLTSYGHRGSWSKMLRAVPTHGRTRWSASWNSSDMRAYRSLCRQAMSALRIDDRDSSLLPTLQTNPTIYNRRRGVVYPGLLPTLTASMGSGDKGGVNPDGPFRPSLVEMARTVELFPTLLASHPEALRDRKGTRVLPTTSLSRESARCAAQSSSSEALQSREASAPLVRTRFLPTLTASSATRGSCPGEAKRHSPNLETVVKLLPTLCARDDHGPGPKHTKGGDDLPRTLGGHLNPEWCLWFMGFPAGWLDVDDAHVFARSATRSSRDAPKSSDG